MEKTVHSVENFFAVMVIVMITVIAGLTTITLSPIAVSSGDVAGINTGAIVSGFIPLKISDLNDNANTTTQLISLDQSSSRYNINLSPTTEFGKFPALLVSNPNSVPINLEVSAQSASEVMGVFHVYVADSLNSYRIIDANVLADEPRVVSFVLEPNESTSLYIELEAVSSLNFASNLSINLVTTGV